MKLMTPTASAVPATYRFSRNEYYRMAEAGLFRDRRVELLNGEIICMSPQNTPHASTLYRVVRTLERRIGTDTCIRGQLPIVLNDWSEPEPDVAVCLPDPYDYSQAHPQPDQIFLLIEVADASVSYDRGQKAAAYALSNISELWIVELPTRRVAILTDPDPRGQRYQQQEYAFPGDTLTLPGGKTIAVTDILPQ